MRRLLPPWLRSLAGRFSRQIALALLLGLAAYGCAALLMFAAGFLISKTADPATTLFMVMTPVACVQLFGLGRPLARYFERLVSHDWVMKVTSLLQLRLFRAARRLQAAGRGGSPLGTYLAVLTDDIGHLQDLFLRVVFPAAMALLLYAGACLLCGWFSVALLLLMLLCGAACVFLLPYLALAITRDPIAKEHRERAGEYAQLTDDVLGIADYQLAGRAAEVCSRHRAAAERLDGLGARIRRRVRLVQLASVLAMGGICAAMLAWCGSAWGGGPEADFIAAFVLGFFPLAEVLMLLPASVSEAAGHRQAIASLDAFFGESASAGPARSQAVEQATDGQPPRAAASPGIAVEVRDLRFAYPGAKDAALQGISLSIESGAKVAVLGRSGSGKSTLLSTIGGAIAPDSGSVALGPAEPAADGSGNSPQPAPAMLDQKPYLFDRTLRQNLALGCAHAADDAMMGALEAVGLGAKTASLAQGLDTPIGETGTGFSGGEAHRVALARVLLARCPLVLLDEPFNALDPETEDALIDTLLRCFADDTLIVATHHLARIDLFDRVILIEDGRVALDGTPAQLRRDSAHFRRLLAFDGAEDAVAADAGYSSSSKVSV